MAFVALGVTCGVVFAGASAVAGFAAGPKASPGALATAVKKTEAEATGRVQWTFAVTGAGQSAVIFSLGTAFDNPHKILDTTLDLRNVAAQEPPSQRVGKVADWQFNIIMDSSRTLVMYMSSPLFQESSVQHKLPKAARHKRWMKIDVATMIHRRAGPLGSITGQLPGILQAFGFLPGFGIRRLSPLAYLNGLSGPASADGTERIDGVRTDRYRMTIDLTQSTGLPPSLTKFARLAGPKWRVEIWVGDHSLIRRVRFTSPPAKSQSNAELVTTSDLFELGAGPHISAPPATDVIDIAKLGP